jgi:uncharacterized membrane protein YraQ (UPF0718 family)
MKKTAKKYKFDFSIIIAFTIFVAYSYISDFAPGIDIVENNFWAFTKEMIFMLPLIFILVGLIDVWVSKEKVQKHIGKSSGIKGIIYVVLFAFIQAGPLYGVFPVTYLMWKKGSSATNIFIFLAATSTARIPMLAFEISFLGIEFSLLRIAITLPIFIVVGIIMGRYFENKNLEIKDV